MQEWLSKNNTNKIRAMAAIGIVYAHMDMFTENPKMLFFYTIGYLCVGIFYFYVGYNCIYTYINSGLRNYVSKKIKRIYVPFIISNLLLVLVNRFLKHNICSKREIIKQILGIDLVNPTLWFIVSVLVFYAVFYIAFQLLTFLKKWLFRKIGENRWIVFTFFLLSFVMYVFAFPRVSQICNFGPNERNLYPFSLFAGGLFALFNKEIYNFVKKNKTPLLIILITLLIILHPLNMNFKQLNILGLNVYDCIPPVLSALIVNICICDEHMNGKILDYIGNISYELYLLHIVILSFYRNGTINIQNDYLYMVVYTVTLLLAAFALHYGIQFVYEKLSHITERFKGKLSENR